MSRSTWLVAMALVLLANSALGASDDERWLASQWARVVVGPDGRVVEADLPDSSLGAATQEEILRRVRQFEFEPATVDGAPASTETSLSLQLAIEPQGDQLAVRVAGASVAPRMTKIVPPRFPNTQLQRSQGARIEMRIAYDTAGEVTEATIVSAEPDLKVFREACLKAARGWRFAPEKINGKAQAGVVQVPVTFEIAAGNSGEIKFPDGGTLRVSRELKEPDQLLSSNLRLRSTGADTGERADAPAG